MTQNRIKSLTLTNFRQYVGSVELNFGNESVILIHGQNGTGKSTLMKAIYWIFYGVAESIEDSVPIHKFIPLQLNETGKWTSTTGALEIETEDGIARIERIWTNKRAGEKLKGPMVKGSDFEEQLHFTHPESGHLVDADKEYKGEWLLKNFPQELSDFFIFDAEEIGKYAGQAGPTSLEASENRGLKEISRDAIREDVENLLGVPILRNMEKDAAGVAKRIQRKQNDARKAVNKQNEFTDEIENLSYEQELEDIERDKWEEQNIEYQSKLDLIQEDREIATNIENARLNHVELKGGLVALTTTLTEQKSELAKLEKSLAETLLVATAEDLYKVENNKLASMIDVLEKINLAENLEKSLAVAPGHCEVCSQPLTDDSSRDAMSKLLADLPAREEGNSWFDEKQSIVRSSQSRMTRVAELRDRSRASYKDFQNINQNIENSEIAVGKKEEDVGIAENIFNLLKNKIVEGDPLAMAIELQEKISLNESYITKAKDASSGRELRIQQLTAQISGEYSTDEKKLQAKLNLVKTVITLATKARDLFGEATRGALNDTLSDTYKFLEQNPKRSMIVEDDYSISFTHDDFEEKQDMEDLSAGEQQMVALSLMSAFNKMAFAGGPIIADSPLMRLDDENKALVCSNLSSLSNQVFLFVQGSELGLRSTDHGAIIKQLKDDHLLSSQFQIEKKSDTDVSTVHEIWRA